MPLERDCMEIVLYSVLKSVCGGLSFPTDLHSTDLSHFAGNVTSSSRPRNWGKNSATNIGQIAIHLFFLETCSVHVMGRVINKVCRRFHQ